MASPKFFLMSFSHFLFFLAICFTAFMCVLMMFSILSEMNKENNTINFQNKRFSLEYESINEWSEKSICCACIKEFKERLEKLHTEFDQLQMEYEKLTNFVK
ncbi:hypothetical protein EJD97_010152, partial [Solanum chilense]